MASPSAELERRALAIFDAALDAAAGEREALIAARCEDDAALRSRVDALLRADAQAAGLLSELDSGGAARVRERLLPPARVGPYRLEELIGSGGMGAVYRARRDDGLFEQTVAIKFMRPSLDRHLAEALMDSERRLLARLQHPGIARILDGGTTPSGLQFLVMEHVPGVPLDEHARGLPVAARVALVGEVCAALAEAHRQLVLHCDIKPSNILIGADGRAKLIDFGIARLLGRADDDLPLGYTRAYASPQRLAGEPPTVGDDLHALGVVLGELVGDADAELAAVVRRATETEPQRRYGSVDALADDLRRWQQRRPLAALPPRWRYRVRKLVQRHPWRVAAGALAATGLVAALATISLLYSRADAARHEAERRFGEVRSLASYLLFDLDARLEGLPGTTALRRELVEQGQRYLDTLARGAGDDPALQREIAVGLGRLAEVQGGWATPNTGERVAARAAFERAEALLAEQVRRRPGQWRWRADLGELQQRLANFYGGADNDSRRQLDKAREAEAQLRRALADAEPAGAGEAERAALHLKLNRTRLSQAFALDWIDQSEAALAIARDEEARLLALPAALRTAAEFELHLGRSAAQLADSLFYLNRFEEALAAYRRARERYEHAEAHLPNHRKLLDAKGVGLWGAALSLAELGRHAEALEEMDRAVAINARLASVDPGNDTLQRQRLILASDRAQLLGRLGRLDDAIAQMDAGLRERRARAQRFPEQSEPARDALVPLHALAELHWRRGDAAAGCAVARDAAAQWAAYDRRFGQTELDRKQNAEKERELARRCAG